MVSAYAPTDVFTVRQDSGKSVRRGGCSLSALRLLLCVCAVNARKLKQSGKWSLSFTLRPCAAAAALALPVRALPLFALCLSREATPAHAQQTHFDSPCVLIVSRNCCFRSALHFLFTVRPTARYSLILVELYLDSSLPSLSLFSSANPPSASRCCCCKPDPTAIRSWRGQPPFCPFYAPRLPDPLAFDLQASHLAAPRSCFLLHSSRPFRC